MHADDLIVTGCEGSLAAAGGRGWGTTPSAMIRVRVFNQNLRTGNCCIVALSVFSFFICDLIFSIMNHDCHSLNLPSNSTYSTQTIQSPQLFCTELAFKSVQRMFFFHFQRDDDMAPSVLLRAEPA